MLKHFPLTSFLLGFVGIVWKGDTLNENVSERMCMSEMECNISLHVGTKIIDFTN